MMNGFFAELGRRNVVRMGALYAVGGWLTLQVADVLFGALNLPEWSLRLVLGMLILGFPVVLVFAWVYEMTPEGLKRESQVDRSASLTPYTAKKLNGAIITVLAVALVFSVAHRYWSEDSPAESSTAAVEAVQSAPASSVASFADDEVPSIAVLPFVNMSDSKDTEYFSDGLSEELLNVLAQIPGLRVAARTSSFQFKGKTGDIPEIARQLRVSTVLEGSVRRAGDRVRVTAQLIKASDGYHLWSGTFDRDLLDVFAIQDEIANKVVESLRITLLGEQQQELTAGRTRDFEAYNQYLMARQLQTQGSYGSLARAVELYEQVLDRDPAYRDARAALVETYLDQAWTGQISNARLQALAGPQLLRVRQLDLEHGTEHADLQLFEAELEIQERIANIDASQNFAEFREAVIEKLEKVVALSPNNVRALKRLAVILSLDGNFDAAEALLQRARQLDPLSLDVGMAVVLLYEATGQWDKGVAEARRMQELQPGAPIGYGMEARIEDDRGNFYAAMRAMEKARQVDPDDHELLVDMAEMYLAMGDTERAAKAVEQAMYLAPRAPETYKARMYLAVIQGKNPEAVSIARQALDEGIDNRGGAVFWAGFVIATDAYRRQDYPAVLEWLRQFGPEPRYEDFQTAFTALQWTYPLMLRVGDSDGARAVREAVRAFIATHNIQPADEGRLASLDSLFRWREGGGDEALAGFVAQLQADPPGSLWRWYFETNPMFADLLSAAPVAAEFQKIDARSRAMGQRLREEDGYASAAVAAGN
jgi:TolB-like protein/tetratricopeptide (TPR) repeat protein